MLYQQSIVNWIYERQKWLSALLVCVQLSGCAPGISVKTFEEPIVKKAADCTLNTLYREENGSQSLGILVGKMSFYDTGISLNCGEDVAMQAFKTKACELGADTIIFSDVKQPDLWSTCYRADAHFYRHINSPALSAEVVHNHIKLTDTSNNNPPTISREQMDLNTRNTPQSTISSLPKSPISPENLRCQNKAAPKCEYFIQTKKFINHPMWLTKQLLSDCYESGTAWHRLDGIILCTAVVPIMPIIDVMVDIGLIPTIGLIELGEQTFGICEDPSNLLASCAAPPFRPDDRFKLDIVERIIKPHEKGTLLVGEIVQSLSRDEILKRYQSTELSAAGWKPTEIENGIAVVISNFEQKARPSHPGHVYFALIPREAFKRLSAASHLSNCHILPTSGCTYGGDTVSFKVIEPPSNTSGASGLNFVESIVERYADSDDCFYKDLGFISNDYNYRYALYCKSLVVQGWDWDGDEFVKHPMPINKSSVYK